MKKDITLQDIATKLKVSKVSVSKALRDHPDISTKTKKRIRETATRLGYTPNYIARNLSARRSKTIGLVVPKIAHHFFAQAIEAVYQTAFEHNYEIIMAVSQEDVQKEEMHLQTLLAMRVDGLLVSVSEQTINNSVFKSLAKRGVPLVFFDRIISDLGFSTVTADDEQGTFRAITEIITMGFTKIAHLAGYSYTNIGKNRNLGFKQAMSQKKITVPAHWIIESGFSERNGYTGMMQLAQNKPLPQVVFTVTYPVALGALSAAKEIGISFPEDMQLLSFGGSDFNKYLSTPISYIDQPADQIARYATELLLNEIIDPESRTENHHIIPTELVLCDNCFKNKRTIRK
jgi:LacI family transcriptional regulator